MKIRCFNIVHPLFRIVACPEARWKMKRMICTGAWLLWVLSACSQWKWDGGAGDSSWISPANWYPDGIPAAGDDVLLDNSLVNVDYEIRLPSGTAGISLDSLTLRPGRGRSIRLTIPTGNRAIPALNITGSGESLRIDSGAVLTNASGANSGDPLQLSGLMKISDGGRYIHATPRANARLIDRLSTSPGTSTGVFEFDVPGTSGYTVSLTGNTFGSLVFRAHAAGGLKSYSGSGTSDLYIRGDLEVNTGAGLTTTLTANIRLDGHLRVNGMLSLQPATAGVSGRSILLTSAATGVIEGSGILIQQHFREWVIGAGHLTLLRSDLNLNHAGQRIRVSDQGSLSTGIRSINGSGGLELAAGGTLFIGHPAGIRADGTDGCLRTTFRQLHAGARYIFDGTGDQCTGDGLPDTIATLQTDKPTGSLLLSRSTQVTSTLGLMRGRIVTSDSNLLEFTGDTISHAPNGYGMEGVGWEGAFIDGPFRRRILRSGTFGMPVGCAETFGPLTLSRTGSGTLTCLVSYANNATPGTNTMTDPNLYRVQGSGYWKMVIQNTSSDTLIRPELPWRCGSDSLTRRKWLDSLRIVTTDLRVDRGWKIAGSRPSIRQHDTARGTILSNEPIAGGGLLSLGMTGAPAGLPVTDISLWARRSGASTRLEWETLGTSQETRFIVERKDSRGLTDTIKILTVTHTRNGERFSFTDEHPAAGWNTYRVCAIEEDSDDHICSGTVAVSHSGPPGLQLFPVPVADRLHWRLPHPTDPGWVRIINDQGIEIWRGRCSDSRTGLIRTTGWPAGRYLLQLPWKGTILSRVFVKS
jgi:hypothetical protein